MRGNGSEGSMVGLRRKTQLLSRAVRSIWPRRWWTEWMTTPGRSTPQVASGPMTEELEKRRLLSFNNVLVNDPTQDAIGPGTSDNTQSETTTLVFTPTGGTQPTVVTAYNDSGSFTHGDHFTGFSRSTNGGTSFTDLGYPPTDSAGD